ncbi:MAG: prolipoprotein diacylglyceryl transferase [Halocynthiibacter sp.]
MIYAIPFPNISPEIFSIQLGGFEFALRWYALAYIAGLILAWKSAVFLANRVTLWPQNSAPIDKEGLDDFMTWVILGVIFGGRLGYVMFYQPAYYLANPSEILQIWQGGMSFHGGFLGVVIGALVYCQKHKIPMKSMGDLMALATPSGLFFGRLANFINGELWGRPTEAAFGVIFPSDAALCTGFEACARHPSQLYEAALEGLLLAIILWALALRTDALKRAGKLLGVFIAGYGLSRFCVEYFRQPDAQFVTLDNPLGFVLGDGMIGLTMGQILSLPMILIGIYFILKAKPDVRT